MWWDQAAEQSSAQLAATFAAPGEDLEQSALDPLPLRVFTTRFDDTAQPTLTVMVESVMPLPAWAVFLMLRSASDTKSVKPHQPWSTKLVQRVASPSKDEVAHVWWALKVVNYSMFLQQLGIELDFCCAEFAGTLGGVHVVSFGSADHWLCRSKRGISRCEMRFGGWHIVGRGDGSCNVTLAAAVIPTPGSTGTEALHSVLAESLSDVMQSVFTELQGRVSQGELDVNAVV
eukprot:TRINITY_DN16835_c0_g1_i1.p1 TRINITY_DN16835_c0_g1~~TRINITY_DN16835_c0_g1_i1.p1  ORF type:complete len:231 (-),score=57.70 TRINITY_DN16835_c0_g1_i1:232-924(-)